MCFDHNDNHIKLHVDYIVGVVCYLITLELTVLVGYMWYGFAYVVTCYQLIYGNVLAY